MVYVELRTTKKMSRLYYVGNQFKVVPTECAKRLNRMSMMSDSTELTYRSTYVRTYVRTYVGTRVRTYVRTYLRTYAGV